MKTDNWREKYRLALMQQEKLEQTLEQQQGLFQRAIAQLTDAAEGHDHKLDERLKAIRVSTRNGDLSGLERMLKSLPRIMEEAAEREQKGWKEMANNLSTLATQLQKSSLGQDLKPQLKQFKKQLPVGPIPPSTLGRQLTQLSKLQQQVLNADPKASTGLFGKLFGEKHEEKQEQTTEASKGTEQDIARSDADIDRLDETSAFEAVTDIESLEDDQLAANVIEAELVDEEISPGPSEGNETMLSDSRSTESMPEAKLERPVHEPAFTRISSKVTRVLTELLDYFEPIDCVAQKAINARARIDKGLNWYELVPTLEDIRDLVTQAYLHADTNYRAYLNNVNRELGQICSALGVAVASEAKIKLAAETLESQVGVSLDDIGQALTTQNNIDLLKGAVNEHIGHIHSALTEFKATTTPQDATPSLSAQLDELVAQVRKMEADAAQTQQQLEEEKTRAVTDNLTGLPNREAYSERVHHELQRWQRYQHPLTLAVLDIDRFKSINDTYGHQAGDKVLKVIAKAVAKRLREVDFMARYGGEEFVMLFPETNAEDTLAMLDKIRATLAKAPFKFKDEPVTVTVSMGIAAFNESDTVEAVFARADEALYRAKEEGRNRCLLAS